ncbi:MAG: HD domain-containing protein [Lachnospiraceae bacterium]|jgi:3'-5' exoribonuclease|nr:HD domain-containing protein [Lachnospiraceae bacterium]
MKYINELREGSRIQDVYLCKYKQSAVTKNGKNYENVILQDRTGNLDAKIWDPTSEGIGEFEILDYVYVSGVVNSFNGSLQASLKQVRKADESEYIPADYLPVTKKNTKAMFQELMVLKDSVKNPYLHQLLDSFFGDEEFAKSFRQHSAAKSVHHGFVGGLLEHTLSVTRLCDYFSASYPILNRDLLITAALLHDVGKTKELSLFPLNEYTDEGQLLGHIMIGAEMVHDRASKIEGFPEVLESELKHCILSHHGQYDFGSPKLPAIVEAVALHMADNTDAKMETMTELLENAKDAPDWIGYSKLFESNLRKTEE